LREQDSLLQNVVLSPSLFSQSHLQSVCIKLN